MNGITAGDRITNGTIRATVVAASAGHLIVTHEGSGHEVVLTAAEAASFAKVVETPTLVIERPFTVYRIDGTRVDGYKNESRALRLNAERCEGEGFFIAKLDPSLFSFVPA